MSTLANRIEKLEALAPAPDSRRLVLQPFNPEDFGGNFAAMDAAIDAATLEASHRGEQLVALVAVPVRIGEGK